MSTLKIDLKGKTKMAGIEPVVGTDRNTKALRATKENVEVLTGVRGNPLDQAVTYRALIDQNIVNLARNNIGTGPGTGIEIVRPIDPDDLTVPPLPTGVNATCTFTTILVTWDQMYLRDSDAGRPHFALYSHTEVWRLDTDDIGNAVMIATTSSKMWVDEVGYDKTYYYWVRHVSIHDVKSAKVPTVNGVYCTTLSSVSATMSALSEELSNLPGYTALNSTLTAKTDIIKSDSEPSTRTGGGALQAGDIWVDTNDNNQQYVRNAANDAWVKARDASLVTLVGSSSFTGTNLTSAMSSAQSDISTLTTTTGSHTTSINSLDSSVSVKRAVYRDDNEPTGGTYSSGDLWVDTNDNNQLYQYNGSSWVTARDQGLATASQFTSVNATATSAQNTANSKIKVFREANNLPTSPVSLTIGDIWINTSDSNKMYIAQAVGANEISGSEWLESGDSRIASSAASVSSLSTAVTDIEGNADASYVLQVNANGAVAGMVIESTASGSGTGTAIQFQADKFAIWDDSGDAATNSVAPFIVTDGVVYIDTARIADGAIESAKIDTLDAGKIASGYIDAGRIEVGTLNFNKLDGNSINITNAHISSLNADKIIGGTLDCDAITVDELTVYDAAKSNTIGKISTFLGSNTAVSNQSHTYDKWYNAEPYHYYITYDFENVPIYNLLPVIHSFSFTPTANTGTLPYVISWKAHCAGTFSSGDRMFSAIGIFKTQSSSVLYNTSNYETTYVTNVGTGEGLSAHNVQQTFSRDLTGGTTYYFYVYGYSYGVSGTPTFGRPTVQIHGLYK